MKNLNNNTLNLKWLWRWSIASVYIVLITYLSLASSDTFKTTLFYFPNRDKVVHFFMYGFFVLVIKWALNGRDISKTTHFFILLFPVCYGCLMEIMQRILVYAGRSFEYVDLMANSFGAITFWFLSDYILRFKGKTSKE